MVCDTHNDDLFISSSSDQLVNEKYLYLGYLGVNSSYSTISINLVYKYEFLIKPELKHVVKPEPSLDDGLSTKVASTIKEVDSQARSLINDYNAYSYLGGSPGSNLGGGSRIR